MLTLQERIEIILLCAREGWSQRSVANCFNIQHPDKHVNHSTISRLFNKFKLTGSVKDMERTGKPKTSQAVKEGVVEWFKATPSTSIRHASFQLGVPKSTIFYIIKKEKFHPYKL